MKVKKELEQEIIDNVIRLLVTYPEKWSRTKSFDDAFFYEYKIDVTPNEQSWTVFETITLSVGDTYYAILYKNINILHEYKFSFWTDENHKRLLKLIKGLPSTDELLKYQQFNEKLKKELAFTEEF